MPYQVETSTVPFLIVTISYLAVLGFIGWWGNRQNRNLQDFFTMSGSAGAVLSGLAYFSTQYSMSTFMGVPGSIYHVGYAGMSVSVPGIAFSMVIPALLVGRRLIKLGHRYKMLTMADYLADRYESTAIRGLLAILMLIFLVPMMGAQTIGAGVIFTTYTGAPQWVLYCMAGGIRSVMMTDVIQGVLMVVTAVTTFFVSLKLGGGLETINAKLASVDPNYLKFPGHNNSYPWQNYASMIVMWSFFCIGQPHLFTKWCGVTGAASFPGIPGKESDFIVPLILQEGLPSIVSALMVAGIFSAGMSTISSLLLTSTSAVSRDLYQRILKRDATDEDTLKMSRVVTVVLGIIAIGIGILKPGSIFTIILFAFGGLGIWAAPIICGMYWKRTTTTGVFASVIIGEAFYFLLLTEFKSLSMGFNPLIVAWLVTMMILIGVSLFTKPVSAETIRRHFDDLDKPVKA